MLSDRRDLTRLADAFERAVAFASDPTLRSVVPGVYAGGMSEIGKKFSRPSTSTAVITGALALALDAVGGLRESALPYMLSNFDDPVRLVGNRQELEAYIGETVGGVLASFLYLPDGSAGRQNGRHEFFRQSAGNRWALYLRRLAHADDPLRQHQPADDHDGGKDFRCFGRRVFSATLTRPCNWPLKRDSLDGIDFLTERNGASLPNPPLGKSDATPSAPASSGCSQPKKRASKWPQLIRSPHAH